MCLNPVGELHMARFPEDASHLWAVKNQLQVDLQKKICYNFIHAYLSFGTWRVSFDMEVFKEYFTAEAF